MCVMFKNSKFNIDISNQNVSKVEDMSEMFRYSKFNKDISKWNIKDNCKTDYMFKNCPIKEKYKPKLK